MQFRYSKESASKKNKKNAKILQKSINVLKDERDRILTNIEKHEKYIMKLAENLLEKISVKNFKNIRVYIIQYCMHPRLMFSPRDAIYSVKFIVLLNKLKTPYFSVIGVIGNFLKEVLP